MMKWGILVVAAVAALAAFTGTHTARFTLPLYAQQPQQIAVPQTMTIQPWLHVEVETSYGWFWQKSKGRAWVTAGKQDTTPMNVGSLCIRLAAHDTTLKCDSNTNEISLQEKKRGIQIKKHTAIVSAWAENPALDTVTVSMEP